MCDRDRSRAREDRPGHGEREDADIRSCRRRDDRRLEPGVGVAADDALRAGRGAREHLPARDVGRAVPARVDLRLLPVRARGDRRVRGRLSAPRVAERAVARRRRREVQVEGELAAGRELGCVRDIAPADERVAVRKFLDVALAVGEDRRARMRQARDERRGDALGSSAIVSALDSLASAGESSLSNKVSVSFASS